MKLTIVCIIYFFSVQAFSSELDIKNFKIAQLVEGRYETLPSKNSDMSNSNFCESEELDINLLQDGGVFTLVIGSKLSFPHLETTVYKEASFFNNLKQKCDFRIESKILNNLIEQNWIESCAKSKPTLKKHLLRFEKNRVEYSFVSGKKILKCEYKLIKQKG